MKSVIAAVACVLFSTALQAQTAKVIQLSPDDAAEAKSLFDQKADIEKRIEALRNQIVSKYILVSKVTLAGDSNVYYCPLDGWGYSFQFSDDFRFIVPALVKDSDTNNSWLCQRQIVGDWSVVGSSGPGDPAGAPGVAGTPGPPVYTPRVPFSGTEFKGSVGIQ